MSLNDLEYAHDETPWEEQFRHAPYTPPARYRLRARWSLLASRLSRALPRLLYFACGWLCGVVTIWLILLWNSR